MAGIREKKMHSVVWWINFERKRSLARRRYKWVDRMKIELK
jgi:hypothetical protein